MQSHVASKSEDNLKHTVGLMEANAGMYRDVETEE